ncbi:MAG: hypothetical protein IQL11_06000, partial [Bacteroidales bacterium]|nr:hypothetical protein [Bacteroidales bacterium]
YAAITLSCVVNSHVLIDIPLTIAGACKASTTVASINKQHSGNIKDAPHFRDRGNYVWDSLMPEIYSLETIWAETALKAAADMGREDLRKEFNTDLFLVKNILRNTDKFKYFITQTYLHLKKRGTGSLQFMKLLFIFLFVILKYLSGYFGRQLRAARNSKKNWIFHDVKDIKEATSLVIKILNENENILNIIRNGDKLRGT